MRNIFIEAKDLLKVYGPTIAVNHLDINIYQGEVLALVGGNGAGKSTLIKLLSGIVNSDAGSLVIGGEPIDVAHYSPAIARAKGIRVVHQELSLCKNLTVYENFYIEQYEEFKGGKGGWRKQAQKMAQEALDKVFPGHGIDVTANLATLSIAQQQMTEIARATCNPDIKLLILDEPTSSLPAHETEQLEHYIKKNAKEDNIAYIYISHRFDEIMYLADYVFIMQNGVAKHYCPLSETSVDDMVDRMGQGAVSIGESFEAPARNENISVKFSNYNSKKLHDINNEMYGGEIVTLTGLEGNGQLDVLHEIFENSKKKKAGLEVNGRVAYVAGDRKKEGIMPLWSIKDNTIISTITNSPLFSKISAKNTDEIVNKWNGR